MRRAGAASGGLIRNAMTDSKEQDRKTLSLGSKSRLSLGKSAEGQQVRQSFSHGRSKTVQVEVKRKRHVESGAAGLADGGAAARMAAEGGAVRGTVKGRGRGTPPRTLTKAERDARERALAAAREEAESRSLPEALIDEELLGDGDVIIEAPPEPEVLDAETLRAREMEELARIEDERRAKVEEERKRLDEEERKRKDEEEDSRKRKEAERAREKTEDEERRKVADRAAKAAMAKVGPGAAPATAAPAPETEEAPARGRKTGKAEVKKAPAKGRGEPRRRGGGKLTVTQVLSGDEGERTRSLASVRRARERERREAMRGNQEKFVREVVVPETITVQELANRMAERGADVIKALMKMGVMSTINQSIDADTAELVVGEFGHRPKRVSEADVEIGLEGTADRPEDLLPRPPVVTVMGHVDHGKTSLLDALRHADVVSGEAGGITQHIGAYQVELATGDRITFIDTPGHAAFTQMRARGATTTDVVVLVVAADDGVMPQTVEAVRHAKAAGVPIVVAINKCDLPDADPDRARNELLQYEVIDERMGGDVQSIEVSAKTGEGLDRLQEAILLQAEVLELKANPHHTAQGVVIEARLDRGRGPVATVLVQRGTLRMGEIFVCGTEWGRVRAMIDDRGEQLQEAEPARPVEVLGLNGTPQAGDDFVVVENEQRAREISAFRDRKKRELQQVATRRGTLEQMFQKIHEGEAKELPVVIKGDVQGSVEAIAGSLEKLSEDVKEAKVTVLHAGVGGINESDVTLAAASDALVIGFNVRANPQARELARRDGVDIRYYNVIYNVIDDVKASLTGLMSPTLRENFLGYAQIREVFNITKVGKVAGCYITEGQVKRGAKVRLLRDDVVIHEGTLKTLKRFKDDVREVREGYECGMAFENYDDIRVGDMIEAFEVEEVAPVI
jgi:translation initiation factor IF-2